MFRKGVGRGIDPIAAPGVLADLPVAVVDKVVAAGTELGKIGDVSGPVVLPVPNMVGFAPLGRGVAGDAPTVSGSEHNPLGQ